MAIPRFDLKFSTAVSDMQSAADLLRYLRDSAGDLQMLVVTSHIPDALAATRASAIAAGTECQMDVAAADQALTRYPGAPQTVAALQGAVGAILQAAQLWKADVQAWLAGLTVADLVTFAEVDLGAGPVGRFVWADGLPEAKVAPLRQSAGLASLIVAFESAGATA